MRRRIEVAQRLFRFAARSARMIRKPFGLFILLLPNFFARDPVMAIAGDANSGSIYTRPSEQLDEAIRAEMKKYGIHGIAVALVDDQRVVHLAGLGDAKPDSIFRAGSISKLFNALAVMQLVE